MMFVSRKIPSFVDPLSFNKKPNYTMTNSLAGQGNVAETSLCHPATGNISQAFSPAKWKTYVYPKTEKGGGEAFSRG